MDKKRNSVAHSEAHSEHENKAATDSNKPYWPYWYIHGRLYDLRPWLKDHPGGADFLLRCQGLDSTAAFEIHHMRMPRAKAMLRRFEVKQDPVMESPWPQFDWTQYGELRARIATRLQSEGWQPGPQARGKLIALFAFVFNLTVPFIWADSGLWCILLALVYAMNMIIMTGFGHVYLHLNTKWQYLGDLGGFSSHSWKTEHCLQHHLYTNHPDYDPDVTKLWPLLHFNPERRSKWQKFAPLFVFPLYALAFMVIRLVRPLEIIKDPTNWKTRVIWYVVGSFGWLALWAVAGYWWVGIALEALASFLFLGLTLSNHNHQDCHFTHQQQDFVRHQMNACHDFGSNNYWSSLTLSAFLGSQTLHHLFPTLDPAYFHIVEDELKNMGYDYKRHSFWLTYIDHLQFISQQGRSNGS